MEVLTLRGRTRTGSNHVRQHGDRWVLRDTRPSVAFSGKPGPWLLLESLADLEAGKGQDAFLLWVHAESDADHLRPEPEGE